MKYISLFAGIGGFDLALNRLGHECIYANDFDKYATKIYEKNLGSANGKANGRVQTDPQGATRAGQGLESAPGQKTSASNGQYDEQLNREPIKGASTSIDTRDIRDVSTTEIPDGFDLLVGGFPCQAFSIAGKRGGFSDTRGTLFFEIARILKDKQPKYFILENVKGLLSHDGGRTFKTIISALDELGYDLEWQVLNSKDFGVPQNRERVYIVGHTRRLPRTQIFPLGGGSREHTDKANKQGITSTLTGRSAGGQNRRGNYIVEARSQHGKPLQVYEKFAPTIQARYGTGGNNVPLINAIRRLTPVECERLQGFPDGWTEGISDTQRYKVLGNAVTVNVVFEIARRLNI